jgi:hypothetical protein
MDSELICPICVDKYKLPALVLPCGLTICERHLKHSELAVCPGCKANHNSETRLPVNKSIEKQLKLSDANKHLSRVLNKFEEFKAAQTSPDAYVDDFFNNLDHKIEDRQNEVIQSLNTYFEKMKARSKEARAKCRGTDTVLKADLVKKFKKVNSKRIEEDIENLKIKIDPHSSESKASTFDLEGTLKEANDRMASIEKLIDDSVNIFFHKDAYLLTQRSNYINFERIFGDFVIREYPFVCFFCYLNNIIIEKNINKVFFM